MKKALLFVMVFGLSLSYAQEENSWTVDYSKSKSFIENRGQFDAFANETTGKIHYAVDFGFSRIFFGERGVCYSFREILKKSKQERQEIMNAGAKTFEDHKQKERLAGKFLMRQDEVNLAWVNSSAEVQLIGVEKTPDHHGYSFDDGQGNTKSIGQIPGYRKLRYVNVYPNIDIEYSVHPEIGVKYAFILHPGADPSTIQMLYDRDIYLEDGEIHVETIFGDIIDHAPITFYEGNMDEQIASSYIKNGRQIHFDLADYSPARTVVIDPWVQTPNDPNSNWDVVWELDKDAAGNVYVIAGIMPMQLLKYSSAGALQWTHNTPYDTTAWLGTMATDNVGNSYITNGTDYMMQKVNTAGNVVWNNNSPSGGQISTEFWNITFNCDQTKLLVGGTGGNLNIHGRIYDVDMNSGNINSSVQVTSAGNLFSIPVNIQEVRAMCPAPNGKYYFLTLDTVGYISDNLTLCPSGSTSMFRENSGIGWGYKSENYRYNNTGIKAIRADENFFYVHRGNQLQKRSLTNAAIIATASIPGGAFQNVFLSGNQSHNAGIDIDDCGNVYVGSTNAVHKFDQNLNLLASYTTSFNVYDVRVSTAGDIIACGGTGNSSSSNRSGGVQSFAASACVPLSFTCCDATVCIPESMCESDAPISLLPSTPGGTWSGTGVNASGIFDPSISGSGTFSITYTLPCGSETISVTVDPCATIDICEETNGSLTASNGSGTYTWYQGTVNNISTPINNEQDCINCPTTSPNYLFGIYIGCSGSTCATTDTTWTQYATGTTTAAPSGYPIMVVDGNGTTVIISNAGQLVPCTTSNPCAGVTIAVNVSAQSNPLCFGGSNGSATVSASGGAPAYSYIWSPGSLSGATQNTLSAGTYTITAQDQNGCQGTGSVTIGQPAELVASAVSTAETCGMLNGTATGSAVGGTGSYSYSWSPSGGNAAVANGLAAGSYTVTITDQNGCSDNASVTVASTSGPSISLVSSGNVSCFGGNNGAATVSASGGTPSYTYSWSPGGLSGASQNALTAGSYTVTVTDQSGCTNSLNVSITQPTQLAINTTTITPANCGQTDGGAAVSASGGTGSYSYSWSPSGGSGTSASNLGAGTYTVTVTDQNNCTASVTFAVPTTTGPSLTLDNSSPTSCFGATDGSASVSATGGTPGYTYAWAPGALSGATQNALAAGTYTVTVTDINGCTDALNVTISAPAQLTINTSSVTPASCGASDGAASVSVSGGTGSYSYSWNPSGGSGASASNLAAGSYTVTVTDQNNCTASVTFSITNASGPSLSLSNSAPVNCFGGNDGSASVSASGGTPGYNYSWAPGALSGATQNSLTAGAYTVTVTDQNGCTDILNVTISEPAELTIDTTSTTAANCGATDGSATVVAGGGTGVYSYNWSPTGGNGTTAINLGAGTYTVTVTDQNNCTASITFPINTLSGPSISVTSSSDVTCNGATDGSASVSASGGTPSYSYSWAPGGLTGASQNNLAAGIYTVIVTDQSGCTNATTVTIGEPVQLTIDTLSTTPASCGSSDGGATVNAAGGTGTYSYAWSPSGGNGTTASNLAAGNYTVTVTDQNGCSASISFNINNLGGPVASMQSSSNVSCAGAADGSATVSVTGGTSPYSYNWSPAGGNAATASGLSGGSYTVTVTDAAGCISTANVTISEPGAITLTESIVDANCGQSDGSITVIASGGAGGYTYTWVPTGGNSATASGLAAGSYTVVVADANGCFTNASYIVQSVGGIPVDAVPEVSSILEGESVQLNASGATSYTWYPSVSLNCSNCADPVATPGSTTTYVVTGTDANGCTGSDTIIIYVQQICGDLYVPNIFSPNGMGPNANETLCVYGECIAELHYSVYNRWGEMVFETTTTDICWDGMYKGKPAITGVYAYKLYVRLNNGNVIEESGNVTLVR